MSRFLKGVTPVPDGLSDRYDPLATTYLNAVGEEMRRQAGKVYAIQVYSMALQCVLYQINDGDDVVRALGTTVGSYLVQTEDLEQRADMIAEIMAVAHQFVDAKKRSRPA